MTGLLSSIHLIFRDTLVYWRVYIIIFTPLLLSPLIIILNRPEAYSGFVIAMMAIYWIFEVFPLPVTAFLPMILYPLFGVVKAKELARFYIQDTTMVLIAGLMFALVMENVNLHKRIGTGILLKIGTTPNRLLIGIMLPTWLLSMFISNTAATSMMVSAADAVVRQLTWGMKKAKMRSEDSPASGRKNDAFHIEEEGNDNTIYKKSGIIVDVTNNKTSNSHNNNITNNNKNNKINNSKINNSKNNNVTSNNNTESEGGSVDWEVSEEYVQSVEDIMNSIPLGTHEQTTINNISQMLSLAIAYSANIGGTGMLTGTPTNLLVADAAERSFRAHQMDSPITYASWFFFAIPHSCICLFLLWAWLQLYYLKWGCCRKEKMLIAGEKGLEELMEDEYAKLGAVSFGEVVTGLLLILMVLLWLLRDPGLISGYASLFKDGSYISDSTPAIFIVMLLFVVPMERPDWLCWRAEKNVKPRPRRALLRWDEAVTRLPWGLVFLLGGGFAMAEGCRVSGLTQLIGSKLASLSSLPSWILALIITIIISFITEIMSNLAVISLFLPILDAMATDLSIHPLLLMLPAGLAASYAFMLPIATPPNAIVFSCRSLTVLKMIKVGFIMNCLCIATVTLGINTWTTSLFHLNTLPWSLGNETRAGLLYE